MNFTTNWKTSVAGGAAILIPIINQVMPILPPQYATIASIVVMGLGLFAAKDANVTGGTKSQ